MPREPINESRSRPVQEGGELSGRPLPALCNIVPIQAMNTSCFCLEEKNPLRAVCLRVIQNVLFERVIIAVIVLNSVVLALADYQSVDSRGDLVMRGSWRNAMLLQSEIVFTAVFSVECALKVTALGFYGHNRSYLSDRWNWIDFAVVISGYKA